MTLAQRLKQPALPISPQLEARWIQQMGFAVAWLENKVWHMVIFDQ